MVFHWLVNPKFPVAAASAEMRAALKARLAPGGVRRRPMTVS